MRLPPELSNVWHDEGDNEIDEDEAARDGQTDHEEHGEQAGVVVVAVGVVQVVEVEFAENLFRYSELRPTVSISLAILPSGRTI